MTTFNNNYSKNTKINATLGLGSKFEIDAKTNVNDLAIMQDLGGASLEKTFALTPTGMMLLKSLYLLYDGSNKISVKWAGSGDSLMDITPDGVMIPNQVFNSFIFSSDITDAQSVFSHNNGSPSIVYWPDGIGESEDVIILSYNQIGDYTIIHNMLTGVGSSTISHTIGNNAELEDDPTLMFKPNDVGTLPKTIYYGDTSNDNIVHSSEVNDTISGIKYKIDFKGDKIQYIFNPGTVDEVVAVEIDENGVVIGGGSIAPETLELIENLMDIFGTLIFGSIELENEEIVQVAIVPSYWFSAGHIGALGIENTGGKCFLSQIGNPNVPTLLMEKTGVEIVEEEAVLCPPEWGDVLGKIDYIAYDGIGGFDIADLAKLDRTPEISEYVVFGENESTLKIDDVRNEDTLLELNQNGIKISGPIAVNGVALSATARPIIVLDDLSDPVDILVSLCEALHNAGIIEFTDDRT